MEKILREGDAEPAAASGSVPVVVVALVGIPIPPGSTHNFMTFFLKIYLFVYSEREREAETQAEGEAGSMQEAQHGTRSGTPALYPGLQAALNHCATGAALFMT